MKTFRLQLMTNTEIPAPQSGFVGTAFVVLDKELYECRIVQYVVNLFRERVTTILEAAGRGRVVKEFTFKEIPEVFFKNVEAAVNKTESVAKHPLEMVIEDLTGKPYDKVCERYTYTSCGERRTDYYQYHWDGVKVERTYLEIPNFIYYDGEKWHADNDESLTPEGYFPTMAAALANPTFQIHRF